jgi:hypothetical protein
MLLVGFAGALCRAELASIVLADLLRTDQDLELTWAASARRLRRPSLCSLAGPSLARCAR